jgi:hypothetical protein
MTEPSDDKARAHAEERRPSHNYTKRLIRAARERLGLALYLLALALVVVTGSAAYTNVIKAGWGSDAAAWVQAPGTISAIVGAAWLARSEERRARRLRRERNEEAAWCVWFVNRSTPIEKSDVRGWRQRAVTSAAALTALVNRTDHIHPAVTLMTSNAKVLVDYLVTDLENLGKSLESGGKPDDDLIKQIVTPHHSLLELIEQYDARMKGVRLALDKGRDTLPIKDWAAWDADGN